MAGEEITGLAEWLWMAGMVLIDTLWGQINTNPVIGIILMAVILFVVYGIFSLGTGSAWAFFHGLMYITILVFIIILIYVLWTIFGLGESVVGLWGSVIGG